MRIMMMALAGTLALAGCDGPKQKAGEAQDQAAANAAGVTYNGNGPNERLGKAQDKADRAAAKARDAQADALKQQGREIKSDADAKADKLEEQAKAIRDTAKDQARTLDKQAANVTGR
ncbi:MULTISPECIES: hypothetical protein [unclassified Sphingomonas]|uniref:hypothetical protein n=1 Tax=unclassified Sphingomonas TaxID=196159 RepID=UPI00226AF80F|nr:MULTISPECIES: hypothetical protein [unclassified Sphingomonas]